MEENEVPKRGSMDGLGVGIDEYKSYLFFLRKKNILKKTKHTIKRNPRVDPLGRAAQCILESDWSEIH